MVELIRNELRGLIDRDKWREAVIEQETDRAELAGIAAHYHAAVAHVCTDLPEPEIPEEYLIDAE